VMKLATPALSIEGPVEYPDLDIGECSDEPLSERIH
jgi:hypothetical protein